MNIARLLFPVRTLGIGDRVGVWFQGCPHKCYRCANPELWDREPMNEINDEEAELLISLALRGTVPDGFTITGGEPFAQAVGLKRLLRIARKWSDDILIYSGYTLDELVSMKDDDIDWVLHNCAALITGRYIDELNDGSYLRGSSNQILHILNESLRYDYERDFVTGVRQIQSFPLSDGLFSVGIHPRGFREVINTGAINLGLEETIE